MIQFLIWNICYIFCKFFISESASFLNILSMKSDSIAAKYPDAFKKGGNTSGKTRINLYEDLTLSKL